MCNEPLTWILSLLFQWLSFYFPDCHDENNYSLWNIKRREKFNLNSFSPFFLFEFQSFGRWMCCWSHLASGSLNSTGTFYQMEPKCWTRSDLEPHLNQGIVSTIQISIWNKRCVSGKRSWGWIVVNADRTSRVELMVFPIAGSHFWSENNGWPFSIGHRCETRRIECRKWMPTICTNGYDRIASIT